MSDRRPEGGPTKVVETPDGELVERLSAGTATLLLLWLVGIGAGSALLAAWLFARVVLDTPLAEGGFDAAFYVAILGASGPVVLWLTGRAQGHSLRWFLVTAAKIGLVMGAILVVGGVVALTAMGAPIGGGLFWTAGLVVAEMAVLAAIWALATWSADRWIARARADQIS